MIDLDQKMNFIMEMITETRRIKSEMNLSHKTCPTLYITPSEDWQLEIIAEMGPQIKQMCKVDEIVIVDPRKTRKAKSATLRAQEQEDRLWSKGDNI